MVQLGVGHILGVLRCSNLEKGKNEYVVGWRKPEAREERIVLGALVFGALLEMGEGGESSALVLCQSLCL